MFRSLHYIPLIHYDVFLLVFNYHLLFDQLHRIKIIVKFRSTEKDFGKTSWADLFENLEVLEGDLLFLCFFGKLGFEVDWLAIEKFTTYSLLSECVFEGELSWDCNKAAYFWVVLPEKSGNIFRMGYWKEMLFLGFPIIHNNYSTIHPFSIFFPFIFIALLTQWCACSIPSKLITFRSSLLRKWWLIEPTRRWLSIHLFYFDQTFLSISFH